MIKLIFVFIVFSLTHGRRFHHYESGDWDVILFTQNWPVSECLQWKHDNPNDNCNSADYTQWTVHGMWPTKVGTKGPGFCNRELKFALSQISGIETELTYRWLSIHSGSMADSDFWKHEWEKHGTCAVALQQLDSELKYFSKGLDWNQQYNLRSMLERIGMTPGGLPQTIDVLYNHLQTITGTKPFISCYRQKSSGKTYLLDVRLCFNKQLDLVDCDGIERWDDEHPLTEDCLENTPIYYPSQQELYDSYNSLN